MAEQRAQHDKRTLVFQLRGGPHGPHIVRSDRSDDALTAYVIWTSTWNGIVGRRFDWREPDGTQRRYQVTGKSEVGSEVIVTCQCVDID
jgi:hypothetical protein